MDLGYLICGSYHLIIEWGPITDVLSLYPLNSLHFISGSCHTVFFFFGNYVLGLHDTSISLRVHQTTKIKINDICFVLM